MIPFRPTLDRMFTARHEVAKGQVHVDWSTYVFHIDPCLEADMMTSPELRYSIDFDRDPQLRQAFGIPIKVDPNLPRGWIALRREVVT